MLAKLGSPKVFKFVQECAIDHQIPRIRRCACGCLSSIDYADKDMANEAYSTLLDLTANYDWSVRYAALVSLERFKSIDLVDEKLRASLRGAFLARADGNQEEEMVVQTKAKMFLSNDAYSHD